MEISEDSSALKLTIRVGLGIVVANEDRRIVDVVHGGVIEIQAVARLAVRYELTILPTAPVSDRDAA